MATLKHYFGPITIGKQNRIMTQTLLWLTVGHGKYEKFEDFEAVFKGNIDTPFYKGDFNASLTLTDRNPGAPSGPCTIIVNGGSYNGTYKVLGNELHVYFEAGNKPYNLSFKAGGGGTYVGGLPLYGWIGP